MWLHMMMKKPSFEVKRASSFSKEIGPLSYESRLIYFHLLASFAHFWLMWRKK